MPHLTTSATVFLPGARRGDVFQYCTSPEGAVEFFRGYGPIPAIKSLSYRPGHSLEVGALREVRLADGSVLEEQVLELQPPARHAYRVSGFAPPLSWLSRQALGGWTFAEVPAGADRPAGVQVTWDYAYQLTGLWAWPAAALIVKVLMRGAMRRALAAIAARFAPGARG